MVVRLVHMRPKELDWNLSPILKTSYFDEIHTISDRNAFLRVKELAQKKDFSLEALQEQHFMRAYLRQRRQHQVQIL